MLFRRSVLHKIHRHLGDLRYPRLPDNLRSSVHLCERLLRIEIKGTLGPSLDMRLSCRHAGNLAKMPEETFKSTAGKKQTIVTATICKQRFQ
jgi:hypothetical protein